LSESSPIAKMLMLLGGDAKEFEKTMDRGIRSLQKLERESNRTGKALTMGLTVPIAAMGAAAVLNFNKQEQAEMKLRAAFEVTGREVNANMIRAKAYASSLQLVATTGDETVLKLLQLATIQGMNADQSERAARNAIGMAAAFDVNEESAIRMTAALEAGDAGLLRRYIPALKQAKDNTEAVAMAQEMLSNAFELAKAEAQSFGGILQQTTNELGDLSEGFGAIIAERSKPFASNIREIVRDLNAMDDSTKGALVTMGGLLAVIGPVYLGIGSLAAGIRILNTTMWKNPYLAVGAGILAIGTAALFSESRVSKLTKELREQIGVEGNLTGELEERKDIQRQLLELRKEELKYELLEANTPVNMPTAYGSKLAEIWRKQEALRLLHHESIDLEKAQKNLGDQIDENTDIVDDAADKYEGLNGQLRKYAEEIDAILNIEDELSWRQTVELQHLNEKHEALQNEINLRKMLASLKIDTVDLPNMPQLNDPTKQDRMRSERINNSIGYLGDKLKTVDKPMGALPEVITETHQGIEALTLVTDGWVNTFGQGLDNIFTKGQDINDVLSNMKNLFASALFQKGFQLLMTGGLSGTGFFGDGGGLFGLLGFADGGRPPVGRTSIIGEEGPELWIPDQAGTIIPNDVITGRSGVSSGNGSSAAFQKLDIEVRVKDVRIKGTDVVISFYNSKRKLR